MFLSWQSPIPLTQQVPSPIEVNSRSLLVFDSGSVVSVSLVLGSVCTGRRFGGSVFPLLWLFAWKLLKQQAHDVSVLADIARHKMRANVYSFFIIISSQDVGF